MKIKWLSSAEDDLDSIIDHIDARNPVAARRMVSRIQEATERLRPYPFVGRQGKAAGTRELVVPRAPYIVVYSVESDRVDIKRILHTSRQWPPEEE